MAARCHYAIHCDCFTLSTSQELLIIIPCMERETWPLLVFTSFLQSNPILIPILTFLLFLRAMMILKLCLNTDSNISSTNYRPIHFGPQKDYWLLHYIHQKIGHTNYQVSHTYARIKVCSWTFVNLLAYVQCNVDLCTPGYAQGDLSNYPMQMTTNTKFIVFDWWQHKAMKYTGIYGSYNFLLTETLSPNSYFLTFSPSHEITRNIHTFIVMWCIQVVSMCVRVKWIGLINLGNCQLDTYFGTKLALNDLPDH